MASRGKQAPKSERRGTLPVMPARVAWAWRSSSLLRCEHDAPLLVVLRRVEGCLFMCLAARYARARMAARARGKADHVQAIEGLRDTSQLQNRCNSASVVSLRVVPSVFSAY
jgi:hypothetical protein